MSSGPQLPVEDVHVVGERQAQAEHQRQGDDGDHQHPVVAVRQGGSDVATECANREPLQIFGCLRQIRNTVSGEPRGAEQHDQDEESHHHREARIGVPVQQPIGGHRHRSEEEDRVELEQPRTAQPVEEVVVAHDAGAFDVAARQLGAHRQVRHVVHGHERPQADGPDEEPPEKLVWRQVVRRVEDAEEAERDGYRRDQHEGMTPPPSFGAIAIRERAEQRIRDGVGQQGDRGHQTRQ